MPLQNPEMTTSRWLLAAALCLTVLLSLTANHSVEGFTTSTARPTTTTFSTTRMYMVAKKKGTKTKKVASTGGGGGFGSGSPDAGATAGAQIRSVAGHTGSGTKPLRAAANTFDKLRQEFGPEACSDVYVRAPLNDPITFWFVGKIAIRQPRSGDSDDSLKITPEMAIWSQKRLILEYAKQRLRPQNLGGKFSEGQEVWLAPGDSELDVVQNKITLTKVVGSINDLPDGFVVKDTVGYNPEIYVGDEVHKGGLRVQRNGDTGEPINPVFEINESA